jgi:hypothetical protein
LRFITNYLPEKTKRKEKEEKKGKERKIDRADR